MIVRINGSVIESIPASTPIIVMDEKEAKSFFAKFTQKAPVYMAAATSMLSAAPAYAASADISSAFEPLFHVLMDLAGPVCRIMFILGFIMVIIGRPRQGIDKMKWASLGYIGIQWTPMFLKIIRQAGASM